MKTLFRNLLLLLSALWLHYQALAQDFIHADYSLAHGNLPKEEEGKIEIRLANSVKDGTIIYKSEDIRGAGGTRCFLEKYDGDMKRVMVKEYSGGNLDSPFIHSIITFNNKLYALNSTVDNSIPENHVRNLFISELDPESLELGAERKIFEIDRGQGRFHRYHLDVSNDGKTLAVLASQVALEEAIARFRVTTLNATLEITSNYSGNITFGSSKADWLEESQLFALNSGK